MSIFAKIAEQKIHEAMKNGEFDNLPGKGKPLCFEDESWIPGDLRMAYKILKNSGCIPPELELRKDILNLHDLIKSIDDDRKRLQKIKELNFKLLKLNELKKKPIPLEKYPEYEEKILDRMINNSK